MLFAYLDGYLERRQRDLHDQGSVAAIAAHDPKQLAALRPQPRSTLHTTTTDSIGEFRKRRQRGS